MFSLIGLDVNSIYLMYINKIVDRIFLKIFWNFKGRVFVILWGEKLMKELNWVLF